MRWEDAASTWSLPASPSPATMTGINQQGRHKANRHWKERRSGILPLQGARNAHPPRRPLLRRQPAPHRRSFALTLPQFFLQPQAVVLACPVHVHLTAAHGVERAFHPAGADIDVADDA